MTTRAGAYGALFPATPRAAGPARLARPVAVADGRGAGGALGGALVVMLLLLVPIGLSPISGISIILCGGAAFGAALIYVVAGMRLGTDRDLSGYLFVPLLISALQNIYLGLLAPYTASFFIQLSLLTHVVFATVLLVGYYFARDPGPIHPSLGLLAKLLLAFLFFAAVSVVVMKASITGMASSARNMMSPVLFLMLGLLLAERVRLGVFLSLVAWLAWATIAFGFVEYFGSRTLWAALNIDVLWLKKGIPNLMSWGMPANFFSSEYIFGEQLRRMVSSYADPVNFGAVLFLFFMVAWYTRRWLLLLACVLCMGLAVSKGALLGLLVFGVVLAWYSGNRVLLAAAVLGALAIGGGLVAYTKIHSTQSVAAHAGGLAAAIKSLPEHPFGRGLGGVGVLAHQPGEVRESGLGLIIGQLGVVGILAFGGFFAAVWRWLAKLTGSRERVMALALFLGICGNIAFNEVALSPNSSAGYFMLLGLLVAGDWLRRGTDAQAEAGEARRA